MIAFGTFIKQYLTLPSVRSPFIRPEPYTLDYKCRGWQDVEKMDYSQELGFWKCALNSPVE